MEIKDVDILKMLPIVIDNILINEDLSLNIPNNYIGENILHWKKSKGGLFLKDLKNIKKNIKSKYVKIKDNNKYYISKIIKTEELEEYSNYTIHQINDVYYIKIKNLFDEKNPNNKSLEIEEDDDIVINTETYSIPLEDEEIEKSSGLSNMSLFED